jgi:gliding motility-associated-like protein
MVKNYTNFLHFVLFFIFLSLLPSQIYAQCAGTDGSKVICDIDNPIYDSISLFSLLGGTPTPGGTWSDDSGSKGLNITTGVLNGHLIRNGGTYQYTYTAPAVAGCTVKTSKVLITIGAFSGNPSPYATKCSDERTFNLFSAFNSTVMGPHLNGTWRNTLTGDIVSSTISISAMRGNYQFTYTVPPVLACSAVPMSSTIILSVFRAPESGIAADLTLCGTTDLAPYTDLDLDTRLTGADPGGRWRGLGITSASDHNINLQELFDTYGAGEYTYSYTVSSDDGPCPDATSNVLITLEKRLDFTGAKIVVNSDICENEIPTAVYSATITQGPEVIPNGEYKVTFNVSGPNGGSETITANFVNGVMSFPVKSSYFRQVGKFIVNVTGIAATAGKQACINIVNNLSDDLNIYPLPHLDGAVVTASPICQNKDASIQFSGASQLSDGNYDIIYNITGDNFATAQTANITVSGGSSGFVIPGTLNVKSGVSTITIIKITNTVTGCTNVANTQGNLIINPLPNAATVKVLINDVCFSDPVSVTVSGLGNLTDATLSYTLSDGNSSTLQTAILTVVNGNASFIIPSALLLNTGSTTISASNLKNNSTTCDVNLSNVSDSFLINPVPAAPVAGNQEFCKVDRATIANLLPGGSQYKWYTSATATTALADNYVLKSENLYVRETSAANCTSLPTMISVLVNDTPAPILNPGGQNFCGLANPTIANLSNATNVPSTVAWYDSENNGNLLASTTLLVDKATYYGFDLSTVTDCISDNNLEVKVSLTDCDVSQYAFFIPDGFSPNGDNVNDTFRIPDIEYLYPDYTLEIFNRYGNVMFKGNINKPNWDGRNSEAAGFGDGIAPNGVYFYIINFNKDSRPPQQGRLYLNR